MNENNIFDLTNVDDLPEDQKRQLKLINVRDDAKNLLGLFELKNRLSIDEIIVGLYRLHKMIKSRTWVSSTLYNLSKKSLIKKVDGSQGEYEKF